MIRSHFQNILFATGAALSSATLPQNAEADPVITITHPDHVAAAPGAQKQKDVDCGTLKNIGGKYFMTCEFGRQVDANSQDMCASNPSLKVADNAAELSQVTSVYLVHFGKQHKDCVKQSATLEFKAKINGGESEVQARAYIDRTYPKWNQSGSDECSLLRAYAMCKAEMN